MLEEQLGAGDRQIAKEYPIVGQLIHTGKVAGAIAVIASLLGAAIGAVGYRVVGPPQDIRGLQQGLARVDTALTRRIDSTNASMRAMGDSIFRGLQAIKTDQQLSSFIQCVTVRRLVPDLRPPGCDGVEERTRRNGRRP